ncbi:hypothetical protein RUR49_17840 [Pseudoxanthobacter sp. M-2]
MVHIISKRDGPRREDVEARRLIQQNRGTIEKLANHLSAGRFGEMRRAAQQPAAPDVFEKSSQSGYTPGSQAVELRPYVRISPNNRVVVADLVSGRQLHYLGELRGPRSARRFRLATRENGFYVPLESDLVERLADLDGRDMAADDADDLLKRDIADRLDIDHDDDR